MVLPVLVVLVLAQSRFEQESGSPCYEKDQDGNDDLNKSQVFYFSQLHKKLNYDKLKKRSSQMNPVLEETSQAKQYCKCSPDVERNTATTHG